LRRELPYVMISHAAFPLVAKDKAANETNGKSPTPASLSKKWITGILRKKIGYRGLVISDDLEMGGARAAAPIEQAAVGHIRAGGDLALICHKEDFIIRAHEAMIREAKHDRKFAQRIQESTRRVFAFKKKHAVLFRAKAAPSTTTVEKLTRNLWEFGEQVRLANLGQPGVEQIARDEERTA
jgi:beta-N-acetylhexosaminidase